MEIYEKYVGQIFDNRYRIEKVIGIGEAAGMFPIDSEKNCYDEAMLAKFN